MKYGIHTIDDFDVCGKTVLMRVDINQPVDKENGYAERHYAHQRLRTHDSGKELSDKGAKLVLMAHQGSDIEYKNYYNLGPHAKVLSELT